MNISRPTSHNGEPIILAIENVPHIEMVGGQIIRGHRGYRLTYQQQHVIHSKMTAAAAANVPLVIILWPNPPRSITTDPDSKLGVGQ